MMKIILPRWRPLAASLFAFVVVPGVTAASTMLGFLATAAYLHEGGSRHGDGTDAVTGFYPGEVAWVIVGNVVIHRERGPEAALDAAGRARRLDRSDHAHAADQRGSRPTP